MTSTSTPVQTPVQPAIELLPPSFTVRVGKRRLTLSWRARKPLPGLLSRLLQRAWAGLLAPGLRLSLAAAAVAGAWQAPVLAAAPAANTLPAGWSVVNGNLSFSQNGNTLNINQGSSQAIARFASFSIGADAAVNVAQPSSSAALLAKVSGADISQIYGKLSANGTVVLYNPNGVVVGPSGTIDAARFIATSLAISDSDFLAGKLNFTKDGTAGLVDNQGKISSATGGSVYLIGGSVSNSGIITSPQGEVILAAGQTVTLADTATPGVTVNVTGSAGDVTNLGTITAEAGRIGVAAGLITNSGVINASSVVREGGRIFLRASGNLTTTASSNISADGTTGGNVTLYAENKAFIDGNVSALGTSGQGGFVDTSGLQQLDVVKVPKVGSGGTWLIDPYDLEVVSDPPQHNATLAPVACSTDYAITSTANGSQIQALTISNQLSNGTSIQLVTGSSGSQAGNITVSADIIKSGDSVSTLTLNAANNISINANITAVAGMLNLNLNTGIGHANTSHLSTIGSAATITLNGGDMVVRNGYTGGFTNGTLAINGTVDLGSSGGLYAGQVTVGSSGQLLASGDSDINLGGLTNNGTFSVSGGYSNVSIDSGGLVNNGNISLTGPGRLRSRGNVVNNANGSILVGAGEGSSFVLSGSRRLTNNGTITLANGSVRFRNIDNNANATITGSGVLRARSTFYNAGTLSPGGTGAIGTMTLSGGTFEQADSGRILIDIASDAQDGYDRVIFNTRSVTLGGTLQTHLLNAYDSSASLGVFSFAHALASYNNFRYVTGDIVNDGGTEKMIKAIYSDGTVSLALRGPDTFTLAANQSETGWGDSRNWVSSSNTALPTQIDTVIIGSERSLSHQSGDDAVANLIVTGGSSLYQNGGNLSVRNSATVNGSLNVWNGSVSVGNSTSIAGEVRVDGGNLSLNGTTGIGSDGQLTLGTGTVTLNGTNNVEGSIVVSGGGALTTNGTTNINGSLNVSYGTVTMNGINNLAGQVDVGDTLTLNGANNVSGSVLVSSGTMALNGDTRGAGSISIGSEGGGDGCDGGCNEESFSLMARVATSSGSVTINNASQSALSVDLLHGSLTLGGNVRLGSLAVGDGQVTGNVGSRLVVAGSFSQGSGNMTLADAALVQDSGTLSVGNISAANLLLQARQGNISQNGESSLHVSSQLIASASSGITLNSSANQIAGFAASNSGSGDITLVNRLNTSDATVVAVNGVTAANGSISIDNTGGVVTSAIGSKASFLGNLPLTDDGSTLSTSNLLASLGIDASGQLKSTNGAISVVTHSPLTIGSGGVNASDTITLTASASSGNNDTLTINGVLVTTGGNINLSAGDSMTINANISTAAPGVALFSVASGQLIGYAQGVTITDANGTRTPVLGTSSVGNTVSNTVSSTVSNTVTSTVVAEPSQTAQVVQQQQNQQTRNLQTTLSNAQVSDSTVQVQSTVNVVQQTSTGNQTVGGTADHFGDEGDNRKQVKKPLPMCT